ERSTARRADGKPEELDDGAPTDVPLGQWWHAEDRVIFEQRGEGVFIALLPGADVAFDQLALLKLIQPRATARGCFERCAGALQGAVDRDHRGLQKLGDLARGPAQHVAQNQDRALARTKPLQRGDERQLDRLLRLVARFWPGRTVRQL